MGYPRSLLVDPKAPGAYHCISRCVRRAWLCGQDQLTGKSFEHRRHWLEDRIHHLSASFAGGVYAYAVMSNHVHVVLHPSGCVLGPTDPGATGQWSDIEVIERWRRIFTRKPHKKGVAEAVSPQDVRNWRERLGSLSWFMRALNEQIARRANAEDDCTGRFWEGRLVSQALLDDRAFLAAMAYADLNPVRAGMASTLADSRHTGVARRLALLRSLSEPAETSIAATAPPGPLPKREPRIKPIAGALCRFGPDVSESQYLELVAWTAGQYNVADAATAEPSGSLKQIGCDASEWGEQLDAIRQRWRVVGGSEQVRKLAERIGQLRFARRRRTTRRSHEPPSQSEAAHRAG